MNFIHNKITVLFCMLIFMLALAFASTTAVSASSANSCSYGRWTGPCDPYNGNPSVNPDCNDSDCLSPPPPNGG